MKLAIKLAKALCEASNSATWARFWSPINPNKVTVVINKVTNTSIKVKPRVNITGDLRMLSTP